MGEPIRDLELVHEQTPRAETQGAMVAREQASAMAEIQSRLVIAQRNPRDEMNALKRIEKACARIGLAESALYRYKRGTTTVEGPSIRLAEALAQAWGNIEFGVRELGQSRNADTGETESEVESFAWDLETNTRQVKVFKVAHKRKANNAFTRLEDPRDIYEKVANDGARRMRACILGIIPGDIIDQARVWCEETIAKGGGAPLVDRVRKMVLAFQALGVPQESIEKRLNHTIDLIVEAEFVELTKTYKAIRDGVADKGTEFDIPGLMPAGIPDAPAPKAKKGKEKGADPADSFQASTD